MTEENILGICRTQKPWGQKFYCGKQKFAYRNHIIVTYIQIDCLVVGVKQDWLCRRILNKLTFKYYQKHKWMNTIDLYIMENCAVICDHGAFSSFLKKKSIFQKVSETAFTRTICTMHKAGKLKWGYWGQIC